MSTWWTLICWSAPRIEWMTKLCVLMFRVTPGVFYIVPRRNRKITAFFLHTYLISCNVFGRRIIASAYIAWCGFCAHLIASFLDPASHASISQSARHEFLFGITNHSYLSVHLFSSFTFRTNTIMLSSSTPSLFVGTANVYFSRLRHYSRISRNVNTKWRRRKLGNGAFALFNLLFPKSPIKCFQSILLYFASLKFIRMFELNREVLQDEPHMFGFWMRNSQLILVLRIR